MASNLAIDEELLKEAQDLGGKKTKTSTVNEALREYVERRKRLEALRLFGKIDFLPDYSYKKDRKKR